MSENRRFRSFKNVLVFDIEWMSGADICGKFLRIRCEPLAPSERAEKIMNLHEKPTTIPPDFFRVLQAYGFLLEPTEPTDFKLSTHLHILSYRVFEYT